MASQLKPCKHEHVKDDEPKGTTFEALTNLSAKCLDCGVRGIRPIGHKFTAYMTLDS